MIHQRNVEPSSEIGITTIRFDFSGSTDEAMGQYFTDIDRVEVLELGCNITTSGTSVILKVESCDDTVDLTDGALDETLEYTGQTCDGTGSWIDRNEDSSPLCTIEAADNVTRRLTEKGIGVRVTCDHTGSNVGTAWAKLRVFRSRGR
jgi:hypothetical protein